MRKKIVKETHLLWLRPAPRHRNDVRRVGSVSSEVVGEFKHPALNSPVPIARVEGNSGGILDVELRFAAWLSALERTNNMADVRVVFASLTIKVTKIAMRITSVVLFFYIEKWNCVGYFKSLIKLK